jgi:hypothetical protein
MKTIRGWKRISRKGGFINETTGQTLIIVKQEFAERYHVLLFKQERIEDAQGSKISPEYASEAKAEAFAIKWMEKNPNGATV